MSDRIVPYGNFNFLVNLNHPSGPGPEEPLGGFSDVSGIMTEQPVAEYRAGNDRENHVRKIPGVHKVGDVTLKRGVVRSADLWAWIDATRRTGYQAKREVVITLRDENGKPIEMWKLRGASPLKYTGPTLAGKGGTDVAMEELVLSAEAIELEVA